MSDCEHRRTKTNYPFGRRSRGVKTCKDCGEIVKPNNKNKSKKWKL